MLRANLIFKMTGENKRTFSFPMFDKFRGGNKQKVLTISKIDFTDNHETRVVSGSLG